MKFLLNYSHNVKVRSLQVINHLLLMYGLYYIYTTQEYFWLITSVLVYWIIGVLGINVYLHRLLSHRSFKTYPLIEKFLSYISVVTTVGSPIAWVAIHRQHHRSCEKENDPHSPYLLGNLKAWFGFWNYKSLELKLIRDIRKNNELRFIHKNYIILIFLYVIILSIINPLFVIFVYAIPACLCLHSTSAIIVLAHKHGYKTYDLKQDQARNSWIANIITLGEGWHNNHHAKPYEWSNWERWWEWDVPAMFIKLIRVKK